MTIPTTLNYEAKLAHINSCINNYLNNLDLPSKHLADAIYYAVMSGGKRLRPILVYLTGEVLGVPASRMHSVACAIEFIHCYSLVHDDLPAMDNDDLRRGLPTCHRAFDEATAILTGDALQTLAFQIIVETDEQLLSSAQKNKLILEICHSSGPLGMVSGQALDLECLTNPAISATKIEEIHLLKTGKLLKSCIVAALIAANENNDNVISSLFNFGSHLGLLYQIQDDYLDQYAKTAELGKAQGSDTAKGKHTYASLYSQTDLQALILHHQQLALDSLKILGPKATPLVDFANYLLQRSY